VPNGGNPLDRILALFAERLHDAPGAARLTRLAKTAQRIPAPLLADLEALIEQLDVQLIGDDIAAHLFEISHCDARCPDATEFARALKARLQHYIDNPLTANNARGVFRERTAWWRMALSRAGGLCQWPTTVLMEQFSMADTGSR
jgi:hypothetical protein